jgi:ribosomal protein S18 acetylase RimI-like enzyme
MAQIQIARPQPAHIGALREIYLAATAAAPHCRFTPDVERFGACLLSSPAVATKIFVAEEDGAPQGFAALGRVKNETDDTEHDAITALFFAHAAAGQALLKACESQAHPGDLLAFPASHGQCPITGYNGGWDGLPDRLPAVAQLLARNGYTPYYRELHLSCDLSRIGPAQAAAPPGVNLQQTADEQTQTFALYAMSGEHKIGECHYITLAHMLGPSAAHTGYIAWLYVEAQGRRRGIGRYLMVQALGHLRRLGCDSCWLTTGADNWPAQPLYLALGFEVLDCSASYRKARAIADCRLQSEAV